MPDITHATGHQIGRAVHDGGTLLGPKWERYGEAPYDVVEEVILKYQTIGLSFEHTCCLYSCAPFVTKVKLIESFKFMLDNNFDSVFQVMTFGFPVQRALKLNVDKKISFFYPEYSLSRSQDLVPSYHDAGQFYWMETENCIVEKRIVTNNTGCVIISEIEGQDIDNEIDWKLAELKYELLQSIV